MVKITIWKDIQIYLINLDYWGCLNIKICKNHDNLNHVRTEKSVILFRNLFKKRKH